MVIKFGISIRNHCFEWKMNLYKLGRVFDYVVITIWITAAKRNWKLFKVYTTN